MRALVAMLLVSSLGLLAARCPNPFGPVQGHTVLYVNALPAGSTFQFPPPSEVADVVAEVGDYFFEASYQTYQLVGVADSSSAGDVVGPVSGGFFQCGYEYQYTRDVLESVAPALDLAAYEYVVFVAPAPGCGYNGFAQGIVGVRTGSGTIHVNTVFVSAISLYQGGSGTAGGGLVAHELGHLLGLEHSGGFLCLPGLLLDAGCDEGEYINFVDLMGASIFFGHFNAYQKELLGWLGPAHVVEVTESGRYVLTSFEAPTLGTKALKIRRQSDSWLYVEYRTPRGFDDFDVPGLNDGAIVHVAQPLYTGLGGDVYSRILTGPNGTYAVRPGESFSDVRGHEISVVQKSAEGLLVDVALAPSAELQPPELIVSSTPAGAGMRRYFASAIDASGIDRIEFYAKTHGVGNFDWTTVDLLAAFPAPPGTPSYQVELVLSTSELGSELQVVAFDGEGNVARKPAF